MRQLFITDFIKNRSIQCSFALSCLFDLLLTESISHTLILFGLPYTTSVFLNHFINSSNLRPKAYISAQYKPHRRAKDNHKM